MKFRNGVYKSPLDLQDRLVKTYLKPITLPTEYDITDKMTLVGNQGNEGSCAGFATGGVKEYQEAIDYEQFVSLSPRYVYEEAKLISGHSEGTTLKACMQVIYDKGICENRYWPYIPNEVNDRAPLADKNALKYKIKTYARVTNLTELKSALIQFGATIIGVDVFDSMVSDKAKKTGVVDNPSCWDGSLGGHALCACAYNDKSPYFKKDGHVKVKNSWGVMYGDMGFLYLSYAYIRKNMIDAFSCLDIEDDNPYTVGDLLPDERKKLWV
jgi:C1A family cysteine protease